MLNPTGIYVYKMTVDNGGAPCVYRNMLSLAICKPKIRSSASKGSLIFGFGDKRLKGRLIYAAVVTKKIAADGKSPDLYYSDDRFRGRPDRIYRNVGGNPELRPGARFHTKSDESLKDAGENFGKSDVLLSRDFYYFGKEATDIDRVKFPAIAKMLDGLRQGHRVNHRPGLRGELLKLMREVWRKPKRKNGEPTDKDTSCRCNT